MFKKNRVTNSMQLTIMYQLGCFYHEANGA
jgi:hypothetical protein